VVGRLGVGGGSGFGAAYRQQLRVSVRGMGSVPVLLLGVPQAVTLGWMVHEDGSNDALVRVVFGLVLMSAWTASVLFLAWLVTQEVWSGTFELAVASPTSVPVAFLGKAVALVVSGLVGGLVAGAAALAVARDVPSIDAPLFTALAIVVAAGVAVPATAFAVAPLATLSTGMRAFTNAVIPVGIVLGGFLFPVGALPVWIRPIARMVPISWAVDGLVGAATGWSSGRVVAHLAVAVAVSAVWAVGAVRLFGVVERRFVADGGLPA
jgi:ABC-2 type transport system permease protein